MNAMSPSSRFMVTSRAGALLLCALFWGFACSHTADQLDPERREAELNPVHAVAPPGSGIGKHDAVAALRVSMRLRRQGRDVSPGTRVGIDSCVLGVSQSPQPYFRTESAERRVELDGHLEWVLLPTARGVLVQSIWIVVWCDDLVDDWPQRRWWSLPRRLTVAESETRLIDLGDVDLVELPLVDAGFVTDSSGKSIPNGALEIEGAMFAVENGPGDEMCFKVYRKLLRHALGLCDPYSSISVYPRDPTQPFRGQFDIAVDAQGRFRVFRFPTMSNPIRLIPRDGPAVVRRISEIDPSAASRLATGSIHGEVKIPMSLRATGPMFTIVGLLGPPFGPEHHRNLVESRRGSSGRGDFQDAVNAPYIQCELEPRNGFSLRNLPTGSITIYLLGSSGFSRCLGTFDVVAGKSIQIPEVLEVRDVVPRSE